MDHYKEVNDTFGHQTGESVINLADDQNSAHSLKSDTLCCWGLDRLSISA